MIPERIREVVSTSVSCFSRAVFDFYGGKVSSVRTVKVLLAQTSMLRSPELKMRLRTDAAAAGAAS